ncbi:CidA/LrgA family protein [Virgibacillus sp. W0181]|uniref:CidA/LrgA family protein n=1 Tax=Virgibacillus sp. W0181 TaxID=3391581 RepID=UPI003F4716EC
MSGLNRALTLFLQWGGISIVQATKIVIQLFLLYGIYMIGNWIQAIFHLFVPGSVIGMIILFILLLTKAVKASWIEAGTTFMVNHLAFFFIPVTVGLMNYFELFSGKGFLLVVIVLVSSILVMTTSAATSQWLATIRKEPK